jgi:membrane protein
MRRPLPRWLRPLAPLGSLLKEAYDNAWAHNIGRMAASIAYFGAFSLAPMIVIIATIASWVFGKSATEGLIAGQLTSTFGADTAKFIQSLLAAVYGSRGLTLATVLAILVLVWAATRIVGSVRGALNDIWGVKGHGGGGLLGFLVGKLIDIAMVVGIGFMFLASMLANTAATAVNKYFSAHVPVPGWMVQAFGVIFSLAVTIAFLAIIFRVLPNIKVRFVHILVGATITGILFSVGNYVIGRYLGSTSPGSAFGAAGSLAVLMIWIYYVAYIIIFGAEITRAYAHRAGRKLVQAAATEAAEESFQNDASPSERNRRETAKDAGSVRSSRVPSGRGATEDEGSLRLARTRRPGLHPETSFRSGGSAAESGGSAAAGPEDSAGGSEEQQASDDRPSPDQGSTT